jgi:hypothetical protein
MGTTFNSTSIPENHVWTGEQVQELLDTQVRYKNWKFAVQEEVTTGGVEQFENVIKLDDIDIDIHIRAEWTAADNVTGQAEKQQSRWWRVSKHSRKNEIINAAFACIKMAEEHEMRENFQYMFEGRWTMPYNTHTDVDRLAEASLHLDLRVDTRPDAPKNQRRD